MSTTTSLTTIVMQDDKRGPPSRKQLRLPIIAPKDDQASSISSSRGGRVSGPAIPPRARLPPRSRTGCWTCRTRKVKCDEGRPICGQCSRLGHTCDYNPRLSFRDDTPRVVEPLYSPAPSSVGSGIDDLPPFASLLTDEDRERKAEVASPGTYNVVVNPDSFQHLPEYSDDPEIKKERFSPFRRSSIATSLASSLGRDSAIEGVPVPGDPNIVVLPRFEDLSRRSTREVKLPTSPVVTHHPTIKREDSECVIMQPSITDTNTLQHFRKVVWKQLIPIEHDSDASIVLLDEAAGQFPPLILAMMAVATLSVVQQDGKEKVDALQHYSRVLPELQNHLKSEKDLASNGSLLTHFLMLIYEVAAADAEHGNVWSQHIETLLKITVLRRRIFGGERFPFIIWWICQIDLDALFSGSGSGTFVGNMLNNDLIPPPSFHLYPLGADGSSVVYPEERETLPTVLQLDYEVTILAVRLGLLAHEFRQDLAFQRANPQQKAMTVKIWHSQIYDIQENLRQMWMVPQVRDLPPKDLPPRAQRLLQHAATMYRACIIYSHTSMWPGQRLDTSPNYDAEIATASYQILQIVHKMLDTNGADSRFLVFPLFMAGIASSDGNQKMLALDLVQRMERDGLGRNAIATRQALEYTYDQQNSSFMNTGHSLDVDWLEVMRAQSINIVSFGL